MRRFDAKDPGFDETFRAFLDERRGSPADVDAAVRDIVEQVRAGGLEALLRLAKTFDRVELDAESLRVSSDEIEAGARACSEEVRAALQFAADRIGAYHRRQHPADHSFVDEAGVRLGWRWTPLESVGVYVPGGRAAYPSSLLMNAVPAVRAG